MALTSIGNLHSNTYKDIDLDATAEVVGIGGLTLFAFEIDNTQNTVPVYLKVYEGSPTVGSTDPDMVFCIPASSRRTHFMNNHVGVLLTSALNVACVTDPGTGGTTSPPNNVTGTFKTS